MLWGSEEHVRKLFGNRLSSLEMTRRTYTERAESPRAYCEFFKETFGPAAAIYASLSDQPEKVATLNASFLEFAEKFNQSRAGGAEYVYEYLLVVATKRR